MPRGKRRPDVGSWAGSKTLLSSIRRDAPSVDFTGASRKTLGSANEGRSVDGAGNPETRKNPNHSYRIAKIAEERRQRPLLSLRPPVGFGLVDGPADRNPPAQLTHDGFPEAFRGCRPSFRRVPSFPRRERDSTGAGCMFSATVNVVRNSISRASSMDTRCGNGDLPPGHCCVSTVRWVPS